MLVLTEDGDISICLPCVAGVFDETSLMDNTVYADVRAADFDQDGDMDLLLDDDGYSVTDRDDTDGSPGPLRTRRQ